MSFNGHSFDIEDIIEAEMERRDEREKEQEDFCEKCKEQYPRTRKLLCGGCKEW